MSFIAPTLKAIYDKLLAESEAYDSPLSNYPQSGQTAADGNIYFITAPISKPDDLLKRSQVIEAAATRAGISTIDTSAGNFVFFGFSYPSLPNIQLNTDEKETALLNTDLMVDFYSTLNASPGYFQDHLIKAASLIEYPNRTDRDWTINGISMLMLEEITEDDDASNPSLRHSYLRFNILS